jgi:hypothetical protein
MISMIQRDGHVRRFRSHVQAKRWIDNNLPENDESYTLFSDYIPKDSVFYIESVLHIKECKNCGVMMEVSLHKDEYAIVVCPSCEARSIFE